MQDNSKITDMQHLQSLKTQDLMEMLIRNTAEYRAKLNLENKTEDLEKYQSDIYTIQSAINNRLISRFNATSQESKPTYRTITQAYATSA